MKFYEQFTETLSKFISYMSVNLSDDVLLRLREMAEKEQNEGAKRIYASMFENLEEAKSSGRPICQDTGIIQFYVGVGGEFKFKDYLKESIIEAVTDASIKTPLRPNAVMPFTDKNTGNNIGPGSPLIVWDIVPGSDKLFVNAYASGGGCSLPGFAEVLFPSQGLETVEEKIVERVIKRAVNACPPLIVGIGLGSCADSAAILSKKALLRAITSSNPDKNAAEFEDRIYNRLKAIGFGANGLGGTESLMGVNVEAECHHPATLAMSVSFGCWTSRHGEIIFDNKGRAYSTSHPAFNEVIK